MSMHIKVQKEISHWMLMNNSGNIPQLKFKVKKPVVKAGYTKNSARRKTLSTPNKCLSVESAEEEIEEEREDDNTLQVTISEKEKDIMQLVSILYYYRPKIL